MITILIIGIVYPKQGFTHQMKSKRSTDVSLSERTPAIVRAAGPIVPGLDDPSVNLLPAFLHRFDRPQTRRAYRSDLVQFFGTDHVPADLARAVTFLHVNEHIAQLETRGAKATTIKRRLAAVRGFFDWLEALDLVQKNPAHKQLVRRVRGVSRRDQNIIFLTADQAQSLVHATDLAGEASQRNRALILTLLHCVLRRSEAAAMDVEHIRPVGKHWVLELPNTKGGSDQYVKVPEHVVEEIEATKEAYGFASGPVWRSLSRNASNGNRLSPSAIYEIVRKTAANAALPVDIGAHTLRHTGCTLAIEAGASLQQVKDHARHKNVETTMVYIHQRDRLRDSAADYIELPRQNRRRK